MLRRNRSSKIVHLRLVHRPHLGNGGLGLLHFALVFVVAVVVMMENLVDFLANLGMVVVVFFNAVVRLVLMAMDLSHSAAHHTTSVNTITERGTFGFPVYVVRVLVPPKDLVSQG